MQFYFLIGVLGAGCGCDSDKSSKLALASRGEQVRLLAGSLPFPARSMADASRGAFATLWARSRLYEWEGSLLALPRKIRRLEQTQGKPALPGLWRTGTASQRYCAAGYTGSWSNQSSSPKG